MARVPRFRVPPLSQLELVALLLDSGRSSTPAYLRLADGELRTLLEDEGAEAVCLGEDSIERAAARLAAARCDAYPAAAAQLHAWQLETPGGVTDPVDTVLAEHTQAAFGLGLALGLRLAGAR